MPSLKPMPIMPSIVIWDAAQAAWMGSPAVAVAFDRRRCGSHGGTGRPALRCRRRLRRNQGSPRDATAPVDAGRQRIGCPGLAPDIGAGSSDNESRRCDLLHRARPSNRRARYRPACAIFAAEAYDRCQLSMQFLHVVSGRRRLSAMRTCFSISTTTSRTTPMASTIAPWARLSGRAPNRICETGR